MANIYRQATRVLIYIGSGGELGINSSDRIKALFAWIKKNSCNGKGVHSTIRRRFCRSISDLFLDFQETSLRADLHRFLSLRWFKRLWVIQEVTLAKTAIVIWGMHELDCWATILLNSL
jgi:hypothetical protein